MVRSLRSFAFAGLSGDEWHLVSRSRDRSAPHLSQHRAVALLDGDLAGGGLARRRDPRPVRELGVIERVEEADGAEVGERRSSRSGHLRKRLWRRRLGSAMGCAHGDLVVHTAAASWLFGIVSRGLEECHKLVTIFRRTVRSVHADGPSGGLSRAASSRRFPHTNARI
jgi:hypothetical protein